MKIDTLIKTVVAINEAKMSNVGDKVNKLIQNELWPIIKPLEMKTASGTTVMRRDKDGSVLQAMKTKAAELINQYSGDKKQTHLDVVNAATNYMDVLKLMTNVMMYNIGQGVIKENLNLSQGEFSHNVKDLEINHYDVQYNGRTVSGTIYVSDTTIQLPEQHQDVEYVVIKFSTEVTKQHDEITHNHSSFTVEPAQSSNVMDKQAADQYYKNFTQKYEKYLNSKSGGYDMLHVLEFNPSEQKIRNSL